MNRRQLLIGAAGALATPALAEAASVAPSLAQAAKARGIRFGSAANVGSIDDPQVTALLLRECVLIVPGNELKEYTIRSDAHPDTDDFAPGDRLLAFCRGHDLAMRGHNLYWAKDEYTPKWLVNHDFGPSPKAAAEAWLRDYIGRVCDHFGDALTSWDVVNEAIDERTGEIRSTVMSRILGRDYLRVCFEAARDHLPHTQLVYNDYMSWGANGAVHRKAVLDLLRSFREAKIPVDALGVQGHIGTDQGPGKQIAGGDSAPQYDEWRAFLREVDAMGYGLLVTEFDVNDRKVDGDIAARDQAAADTAKTFMDLTLDCRAVKDFLCWGLDDGHSWLQHTTGRADHLPLRPTPYDDHFQPKPLRAAMIAAFEGAPAR